MNCRSAAALVAGLFLITACASNGAATTPVSVTVTSETANERFTSDVRKATLRAIHEQVPEARPMAVAVDLDIANGTAADPNATLAPTSGYSGNQPVPSTGSDPWGEGATPTVPANGWTPPRTIVSTAVFMSCTIHDANGQVVESHRLRLGTGLLAGTAEYAMVSDHNTNPFMARRAFLIEAADFLASRVKALSH